MAVHIGYNTLMNPGSVITPGGGEQPSEQKAEEPQQSLPQDPNPAPQPSPAAGQQQSAYNAPSLVRRGTSSYGDVPEGAVVWTASEFIHHHKDASWFIGLAVVSLLGAGLVYVTTRDSVTFAMVLTVLVMLGIFASRKPRVLRYMLDESGISIAEKHYPYEEFKTFSVQDEGGFHSISLVPLKRINPGLSLYYPPEQENEIVEMISLYLPYEERQPDIVDRLMKRVRF